MRVQQQIEAKLNGAMPVLHIEVVNESHMHSVPPNSETHFKVVLVSPEFAGKRPVARHQMIYRLLADELAAGVHALALHIHGRRVAAADGPGARVAAVPRRQQARPHLSTSGRT
jgi:BolA protein